MKIKGIKALRFLSCVKCYSPHLNIEVAIFERKDLKPALYLSCQRCGVSNPFLAITITPESGKDLIERYELMERL